MSVVDALLPEFDHEMTITRKVLERVPQDRFPWKPHDKSFSMRDLAQHVATIPLWGSETLTKSELDLGAFAPIAPVTSRDDLLELFDGHVGPTRAALVGISDAELATPWALKRDGHTIFSMPKSLVWRSFVMNHIIHHRAQLAVYLRLNDVAVPSMYGPSADEGGL
jgi:uncharacterized damage-inducible protein DinB